MQKGEIWAVDLDPTEGVEQAGFRPVLIITTEIFNNVTQAPVCLPITNGGNFARVKGFAVEITKAHKLKTTGVIRCDQPRTLDLNRRGAKCVESVPTALLDEVSAKLIAILKAP